MSELAASNSGGSLLPLLLIAGLFALTYFMIIRPQNRRRRELSQMQATLGPGAEVVTIGGLYGTVVDSDDESVTIEADEDVRLKFARGAIARVLTPAPTTFETREDEVDEEPVTDEVLEEPVVAEAADDESKPKTSS